MATETPNPAVVDAASPEHASYVDWPAIIAGAVLATAVSLLFLTFGSAIGLSLTDAIARSDSPLVLAAIAIALWIVWVQVSAFLVGGYVTGRLRRRHHNATEHEVDVRDGLHGLLVWGAGIVFTGVLAFGGIGVFANAASNIAGSATSGLAANADTEAAASGPFDYAIDILFRGSTEEAANPRAETARIIVNGVTGDGISDADRDYLAELVASRTSLNESEAQERVDDVIAQAEAVQDDLVEAAEQARRIGILTAFITAASLAISAAAAWFAAGAGGNHRDKHTVIPFFSRAGTRRVVPE